VRGASGKPSSYGTDKHAEQCSKTTAHETLIMDTSYAILPRGVSPVEGSCLINGHFPTPTRGDPKRKDNTWSTRPRTAGHIAWGRPRTWRDRVNPGSSRVRQWVSTESIRRRRNHDDGKMNKCMHERHSVVHGVADQDGGHDNERNCKCHPARQHLASFGARPVMRH
jgi:hypothetical protein